ncbi:MTH1187 family thiamine-binding protein [Lutibacter sp. TH_r2]|uniref:MTH1187 family thiamine-binding protein n=1 Tax=Lutibacter sp. TH_r2 TaxID=3082083 RepID=UPI0029552070|nr:MTH1187 family thiamine-binding protein [Lutibacter sp. TH_r2]MDV7188023.1 MTH1187 family thiamine-binding protein [Lutibacter sp. TH_r2]
MSVLLEFAMFPTNKGESISPYVSRIIKLIRESGVTYQLTAMGTIIETETLAEALAVVQQCYNVLEPDCDRVYSSLKFDIRKGKSKCLSEKIKSVENIIGKVNT